jgi:tetratricopeptide (TPR) repeat protein
MANAWFDATLHLAAKFAGRGDHADAITVMVPWASWNLPPFENTILAYNLAQMFLNLGDADSALAWYDWGLEHDRAIRRTLIAEAKAALLYEQGRRDEADAMWAQMQAEGWLDDAGRQRVAANRKTAAAAR